MRENRQERDGEVAASVKRIEENRLDDVLSGQAARMKQPGKVFGMESIHDDPVEGDKAA